MGESLVRMLASPAWFCPTHQTPNCVLCLTPPTPAVPTHTGSEEPKGASDE